jgi:hypothetical protein
VAADGPISVARRCSEVSAGTEVGRRTLEGKLHLPHLGVWLGWRSSTRSGIAADPQQVCRLVVQMQRMQRGDEGAPLTVGNRDGFVPHGAGKGSRKWMRQERTDALAVTRDQGTAE